jgi:DHA1 family tetracycline resistance protein-like MFS transporter
MLLPESLSEERKEDMKKNPRRAFSFKALAAMLKLPGTGVMLLMTIFYSFGFTVFESTFSLFAAEHLKADTVTRGILLTYIGLIIAFVQGVLVGTLSKKYDERKLLLVAVLAAAIALGVYGFSNSVLAVAVVLLPMSLASGVAGTVLRSLLSKSAPPEATGGTFGVSASIESMNRIIAPIIGAFAFSYVAPWLPGIIAALAVGSAAIIAQRKLIKENCLAEGAEACYTPE